MESRARIFFFIRYFLYDRELSANVFLFLYNTKLATKLSGFKFSCEEDAIRSYELLP